MTDDTKNVGGFPSNDKSANEQKSPNPKNETGNQNEGVGVERKTERSERPEQA